MMTQDRKVKAARPKMEGKLEVDLGRVSQREKGRIARESSLTGDGAKGEQ